jgi:hypothetical protein
VHALARCAAWAGLGAALLGGWAVAADRPSQLQARQVAADVWFVQGEAALGSAANRDFIFDAGYVVTDDGVLVVGALGSPVLAEALIGEIRHVTSQPMPRPTGHASSTCRSLAQPTA